MHKRVLVANWKCNKNLQEVKDWFWQIKEELEGLKEKVENNLEIIIAPSFPYLQTASELIKKYSLPFKLAAQDLSRFEKGSFTGETGAFQIKDFAQYVILGHSERRRYFGETPEILEIKVKNAKKANLKIIYCSTEKEPLIEQADYIAYEPEEAIGTGKNAPVKEIIRKKRELKVLSKPFLYGGSVNSQNIEEYLKSEEINGFLIGGSSLNFKEFKKIIETASNY